HAGIGLVVDVEHPPGREVTEVLFVRLRGLEVAGTDRPAAVGDAGGREVTEDLDDVVALPARPQKAPTLAHVHPDAGIVEDVTYGIGVATHPELDHGPDHLDPIHFRRTVDERGLGLLAAGAAEDQDTGPGVPP